MKRRRRTPTEGPTADEWAWLTAAPGHNEFLGFGYGHGSGTGPERLRELWEEYGPQVRREWAVKGRPDPLPFGHPAEVEEKTWR